MERNNKGLSIVELIVGVAIMSIVGIAICGFIMVGTKQFSAAQAEVNLQYEAQLVSNQVNDLMLDSVGDIVYEVGGVRTTTEGASVRTDVQKDLYVCTRNDDGTYVVHRVQWKPGDDENKLYYSQYPATYNEKKHQYNPDYASAVYSDKLMGECIDSFTIDLEQAVSDNGAGQYMKLRQHLKQRTRVFSLESNILLRNHVTINEAIISSNPGEAEAPGEATGIVITPVSAILPPGGTQQFTATVKATGKVDTSVNWSIAETGAKAGTTISVNGRLKVAEDETLDKITVVAALASKPSISKTATVSIKDVDNVIIGPDPEFIEQNMTFKLTATVSGRNITNSPQDQAVRWRITEGSQYVSMVGANAFKVSAIAPVGTKVTISATSAIKPSVSDSRSFSVKKASGIGTDPDDEDGDMGFTEWSEYINRGGSGTFKISNKVPNSSVSWKVSVYGKNGTKDVTYKEGTAYVVNSSGTSCTVHITKAIDFEREAKVMVTAIVTPNGKGEADAKHASVTATVKPVSMVLKRHVSDTPRKAITGLHLYYLKNTKTAYLYELEGIENEDVSWRGPNYDKKLLGIKMDGKKKTITLSVPSEKANGSSTALAYIDNYPLGCSISAEVATGNIYYKEMVYDSWGSHEKLTYLYFPMPSEEDFPWTTSSHDDYSRGAGFVDYPWADMGNAPNSENMKVYYYLDTKVKPKRWYIALTPTGEKWRVGNNKFYCVVTGDPETEIWKVP